MQLLGVVLLVDTLPLLIAQKHQESVKIIRPFNCYGPSQSSRAIIPTIVSQLYNNKTNIKLGNLEAIRDLSRNANKQELAILGTRYMELLS